MRQGIKVAIAVNTNSINDTGGSSDIYPKEWGLPILLLKHSNNVHKQSHMRLIDGLILS